MKTFILFLIILSNKDLKSELLNKSLECSKSERYFEKILLYDYYRGLNIKNFYSFKQLNFLCFKGLDNEQFSEFHFYSSKKIVLDRNLELNLININMYLL